MQENWFSISPQQSSTIFVSTVLIYSAILIYTRACGLRSFSKMSAADFAMTIAVGSIFGSTVSAPNPSVLAGGAALLCLFAAQWAIAHFRQRFKAFSRLVDNQPVLLMAGSDILYDNLRRTNVTEDDLFAKLREANALNFDQIRAVVFETTGDVTVVHSQDTEEALEERFFSSVRGSERLFEKRIEAD